MRRWVWILACGFALGVQAADEAESPVARFAKLSSPDGKFVVRASFEDGEINSIKLIEKSSGRELVDLSDDVMLSEAQSLNLVWAKDSKSFGANFQAANRDDESLQYRWASGTFHELTSPEGMLYAKVVEPARQRELKAAGKSADTYLRHIWDTWETVKWIDASTVEIHGESAASYDENDDPVDITVGVEATVQFDKDGKPELLKVEEVPAKD